MIVTLQTQRVQTLEQVRAFVEGSEAVDFVGGDRAGVYALVRRTLVKLDYHRLGKADKGLVKRYLAKVTGLSRAQLTRLIGQHRRTGRIEDRRGGSPRRPFERRVVARRRGGEDLPLFLAPPDILPHAAAQTDIVVALVAHRQQCPVFGVEQEQQPV